MQLCSQMNDEKKKEIFHKNFSLVEIFNLSNERIVNFEKKLRREKIIFQKKISVFEYFSEKIDKDLRKIRRKIFKQ